ncbi:MAG TPA: hypothetical protein VMZ29_04945 [Candidatus Bathyarchaeia archaeon]|nr:hypothetical protein [Candidatus Bathyarchaeia archaeon]
MIGSKTTHTSLFLSFLVVTLACSPLLMVNGELVLLHYENFVIEPSQPPLIAEAQFDLNVYNEYILGIPETDAIGFRSDSRSYRLEIWSTARVEIYILDSSGFASDYREFLDNYVGDAPTTYSYFWICDGYFVFEFYNAVISPKLILFSDGVDATGKYLWTEGSATIEYNPYYQRIVGGDRTTNDTIHIFNLNASVCTFILDDEAYASYLIHPNVRPSTLGATVSIIDSTEISFSYNAEANTNYHLIIWHEEFHSSVNGSLVYTYDYVRGTFEHYWSLFLVILLLILTAVFIAFRKHTLPPTVWVMNKAKFYILTKPWKTVKSYFGEIRGESREIIDRMKGLSEADVATEDEISIHKRKLVAGLSLIIPFSIHRFYVGKYGSAIVSILVQLLTILFIYSGIDYIKIYIQTLLELGSNEAEGLGVGIIFLALGVITLFFYIIDIIATFAGVFKDKNKKLILNW